MKSRNMTEHSRNSDMNHTKWRHIKSAMKSYDMKEQQGKNDMKSQDVGQQHQSRVKPHGATEQI